MTRSTMLAPLSLTALLLVTTSCGGTSSSSETTSAPDTTAVAEPVVTEPLVVIETTIATTVETVPVTDPAPTACSPLRVEGVTDMLISDAESFADSLGASAVANWEVATFGLQCAFEASGISGVVGPGEAAGPGNLSTSGSSLDAGGAAVMPFAVLDTAGNCALRAIVDGADGLQLLTITAAPAACNAYEALDGFAAGQFAAN